MSFSSILLAILALSAIMIAHELGHFIAAKCGKIKVNEFSLFFGKMLFKIKRGDTVYGIRAIPFGASVRMEGEDEDSGDSRSFHSKPAYIKLFVILSGPLMNYILALLLAVILFGMNGYATSVIDSLIPGGAAHEAGIREGDRIVRYNSKSVLAPADIDLYAYAAKNEVIPIEVRRGNDTLTFDISPRRHRYILNFFPYQDENKTNVVERVVLGGPADLAGIMKDDEIIFINNTPVTDIVSLRAALQSNGPAPADIVILRNGEEIALSATPNEEVEHETAAMGISAYAYERGSFFDWVKQSFIYTISVSKSVVLSFTWLITGQVSLGELMGPVGVVSTIGEFVEQSVGIRIKIINLLSLMSMISINLGLFNMFPFPALDGFRSFFVILEGLRRKPILTKDKEAIINFAGFMLLIGILILVTFNDIARIFSNAFGS